ncbi:MAG TPA: carbon-nitrogen hydrolase family protein [Thermoanaerobaculia bacterium]|nr:carbon-nitrogen hydrolase family protein [Thermoanaerobaculia bacterium]
MSNAPFVVAAVQAAPVFLRREATVEKACELIATAAREGARLIVFPEAFVPTYPLWVWHVPAGETKVLRALYAELLDEAVTVPGPAIDRLSEAARAARAAVAIGVNERNVEASGTSLYNTLLLFDEQGQLRARHRKLVPTAGERLVYAPGDGSTLAVHDLGFARVSGLVCWENYMPLARYALYAWGAEVHLAPTWDRGEPWLSTLRHIAKEGRVYVVGSCCAVRREDVLDVHGHLHDLAKWLPQGTWLNPGDSAIVDPDGKLLAGPAREQETILYAECDPRAVRGPRYQLDVAGHYARPDIFELRVRRRPRPLVQLSDMDAEELAPA